MSKPQVIVGIDVGMTCTGVSYINLAAGSKTVRWIQRWPGKTDTNENKVPTVVVYEKENNHLPPTSWGFKSESETERAAANRVYREWFKTQLGPLSVNSGEHDVERWYEDYLKKLYVHIEKTILRELVGSTWDDAIIEYVFSSPTSWSGPTVENFKRIARRAGFEHVTRPRHSIIMGLTEPEAVAVHTSIEASGRLRMGDTVCVCDAGGGTTDLSILKITDDRNGTLAMQQLLTVSGEDVGSTYIDAEFQRSIESRLAPLESQLNQSLEETSWEVMKSRDFQDNKCTFGDHDDNIEFFPVKIPDLANHTDLAAGIKNGRMEVKMSGLKKIFDDQIHKIQAMIDQELLRLEQKNDFNVQVNHLILSGGLSNSAYVQDQIRQRYSSNASGFSSARSVSVWVAPDPQLAVCKGLVEDRSRKVSTGRHVIETRCCRASYGVKCKEKYDEKKYQHQGRKRVRDLLDGKDYVVDAIEWFIKKGEPISNEDSIEREFTFRINPGSEASQRVFKNSVVVSYDDPELLPGYMDTSTKTLVDIRSDLSSINEKQFKQKNKHLWKRMGGRKQHFYECTFEIRVNIGPSDILFELWFNGDKLSKDESIQVQWQPVEMSAAKTKFSFPQVAELDAGPSLPALVAEMPTSPSRFLPEFLQFGMNGNFRSGGAGLKPNN